MSLFQKILFTCFHVLIIFTSVSNISRAQDISIKGKFYLTGVVDYQFKIRNKPAQNLEKFRLEPGLNLEITSNTQGGISGRVYGKIPMSADSEFISDQMLVLSEELKWFPISLQGYSYQIEIQDFDAPFIYVPSQGKKVCGSKCRLYWDSRPQQELYLVLGNYSAYSKIVDGVNLGVALHQSDDSLAEGYLQLLPQIVNRYSQMIGPYPFQEFWVIENQNETGYGMPGFTLLGKSVIRLPFLLQSSLPHEVLHNWFGNSIYVDYEKGNWCEGLTTHLADHFEQKMMKQDRSYRRNAILNYMNFTGENADFPLSQFKGRHSGSTQAVGYDKSMMVFQMIQDTLGEKVFYQSLQKIYKDFYFQQLGYESFVKALFENQAQAYEPWLPWVNEKGLAQISAKFECENKIAKLKVNSQPRQFTYKLEYLKKTSSGLSELGFVNIVDGIAQIPLSENFDSVILDPDFKVFRKLSEGEKPLALSELFGRTKIYAVVDDKLKEEFELWSAGVQSTFPIQFEIISAEELSIRTAPSDLVLFYSENLPNVFRESAYLDQTPIRYTQGQIKIQDQSFVDSENAWVIMGKSSQLSTIIWIKPQKGMDAKAWGRQLTHYTQMGVLVFKDRKNIFKSSYSAGKSDLDFVVPSCQK